LVDPAYSPKAGGYSHLSVTIAQKGQIQPLNEQEATFRISGVQGAPREAPSHRSADNARIVQGMGGAASAHPMPVRSPGYGTQPTSAQSANAQMVERMRRATGAAAPTSMSVPQAPPPQSSSQPQPQQTGTRGIGCFGVAGWLFIGCLALRALAG